MILKYGNYTHSAHECTLAIAKQALFSPRGNRYVTRERWQITGVLHGTSPLELTQKIAALRSAYAINAVDAGLYLDDGLTPTDHVLVSSATLGGVRVVSLEFPFGNGAEYSAFRSYRISLEADFPETVPLLWDYVESLTLIGTGGPRRILMETLDGPPQTQIVAAQTAYRAIQKGRAVGGTGYPTAPSPLWPAAELGERRQVVFQTPTRTNNQLSQFPIEWRYEFSSAAPLIGNSEIP